jgi:hypothetical protein
MKYTFLILACLALCMACEREFIPEDTNQTPKIVVDGHIESGADATPPYVILTKSLPFLAEFSPTALGNYFVHDAKVTITEVGGKTVSLQELCLSTLPPAQKELVGKQLGINLDSLGANSDFCIYLDLTFALKGEEGKTYTLRVEKDQETLAASTTIPVGVALDSTKIIPTPGTVKIDSLAQLRGFLTDPGGVANFYRTFIKVDDGAYTASSNSVVDDKLFDGKPSFEFPLPKPFVRNQVPKGEKPDFTIIGFYKKGSKASVKWCSIDQAHYDFWNTLEAAQSNQGPFSTYTRVKTNINGGLGIWGGYAVRKYEVEIK